MAYKLNEKNAYNYFLYLQMVGQKATMSKDGDDYLIRLDADDDEERDNSGAKGNLKLPYGLCANEGIETSGMTPTDAWNALKDKTGVGHDEVIKKLQDNAKAKVKKQKSLHKSVQTYKAKAQLAKDNYVAKHGEPVHPAYGNVMGNEELKNSAKDFGKSAKKFKGWADNYKDTAQSWQNQLDMSLEEYNKLHWWQTPLTSEKYTELKEKWSKYVNENIDKANQYQELSDKYSNLAQLGKEIKSAEKTMDKKANELVNLANDKTIHVSEETKKAGAQAKINKAKAKAEKNKAKKKEILDQISGIQANIDFINTDKYSGIFKDKTVSASDYPEIKDKLASKIDYYNSVINDPNSSQDNKDWASLKIGQIGKLEADGQNYVQLTSQIADLQKKASKYITPTDVLTNKAYSTSWAPSAMDAHNKLVGTSGQVWQNATNAEKEAAYTYTGAYSQFNEPLRGIHYGTSNYVGVENIDFDKIGTNSGKKTGYVKGLINSFTSIIDKSSNSEDMWLQRGCNIGGMDKFFNVDSNFFYNCDNESLQQLVGKEVTELGFCSTGIAKGKGFPNKEIIMNIFAPAGTKMMYVEPFSQYGNGYGMNWNGTDKQSSVSTEAETVLQRGTSFYVSKASMNSYGKIYVDLIVTDQSYTPIP